MQPQAAGMDIGAHEIWVYIPGEGDTQSVRLFGTYPADLHTIGDWLSEHGIRTVAMESTGVYWIPIFEYLALHGFQSCLISSRASKRVPGRKTDIMDCQWIQTLHSYGLLESSFRPQSDLAALRTLLRHRAQLIQHRAPHIQHLQKALLQMNSQLSQALSDVTGGKVIRSRTYKTKNRAGQAFRLAASSVTRADCAFGAFYRRKQSQIGPAQALVATAHMIARTVYFMLKNKVQYLHSSAKSFDQRDREQQIRYLHRRAAKLGFRLPPPCAVSQ